MKTLFIQSESENLAVELLSSYLMKNDHDVQLFYDPRLFDSSFMSISSLQSKHDLTPIMLKKISDYQPDLVAFSCMTDDYQWALSKARIVKDNFNVPVIFGGHHVISKPDRVINEECVDIACISEGEDAFLNLANSFSGGQFDKTIENLWFKEGNQVIKNPLGMLEENLDKFPRPDKDLFYDVLPVAKKNYATIFSRGCAYDCTYCCNNVRKVAFKGKGKFLRLKSVDAAMDELLAANELYNPDTFTFSDDMITAYKGWFEEFSERYAKEIGKPYICYTHPKYFKEETAKQMRDSNCMWINFGFQTASTDGRELLKRVETNADMAACAELAHKYGITFSVDHILDLPYERVDHLDSSLDFYAEIQPSIINSFYLSYYPTTAIIWDGIRDGKIVPEDVDSIEDGKYITSFTLSLGGEQDSNSEQVSNYQKYFAMFTLIAVLPKRVSEFILKKGLNHGLIGKLPTALLIFLKVVLRFKVGQSYLYTGIVKEQIDNYFRNKRLISDYKSSVVNSAKDNEDDDTAARLLKTITAAGVEQKTAVERNRKVPQMVPQIPAPRPVSSKLTMGQCP